MIDQTKPNLKQYMKAFELLSNLDAATFNLVQQTLHTINESKQNNSAYRQTILNMPDDEIRKRLMHSIASSVNNELTQKGYNMTKLADEIGIFPNTIRQAVNEMRLLSTINLVKFKTYSGVDYNKLLYIKLD